jgi:cytochrome P450
VNIASSDFKANPFPFYARLRSEAPVYRTPLPDKQSAWLITRYEDVLEILKDERFGKDRLRAKTSEQVKKQPWMPDMFKPLTRNMLDVDAPDHTRLRGLVQKAFMPRLVEKYARAGAGSERRTAQRRRDARANGLGSRLCASDSNNNYR